MREAVQWQQLRHQRVRGLQRLVQQQKRVLVQGLRRVLVQGLRRVQERVLAPRRQLVLEPVRQRGQVRELGPGQAMRQVPLSALPEVRWTQPFTVFFLLSACLADYVRGSVASGQRYPQKSCNASRFRRLGRSWGWGS